MLCVSDLVMIIGVAAAAAAVVLIIIITAIISIGAASCGQVFNANRKLDANEQNTTVTYASIVPMTSKTPNDYSNMEDKNGTSQPARHSVIYSELSLN